MPTVGGTVRYQLLYRDGLRPIAELGPSGNFLERFVYADGNLGGATTPAYLVKGGTTYAILTDQLGSPRLLVDTATGNIAEEIDYDAWGNVISDTNPGFQPFGFAGGLYDQDTKLVRFGVRDYDPETGRWTAPDPLRYGGGHANLYEYVGDDPVVFRDPRGTIWVQVAGAVIGGAASAWSNYAAYESGRISGPEYAATIAFGMGTGVLATLPTTLLGGAVAGGLAAGANDMFGQLLGRDCLDYREIGRATALGVGAGVFAGSAAEIGSNVIDTGSVIGERLAGTYVSVGAREGFSDFGAVAGVAGNAIGTATTTWWGE